MKLTSGRDPDILIINRIYAYLSVFFLPKFHKSKNVVKTKTKRKYWYSTSSKIKIYIVNQRWGKRDAPEPWKPHKNYEFDRYIEFKVQTSN